MAAALLVLTFQSFLLCSFGKRVGGAARRHNECLILEHSEMIVVSYSWSYCWVKPEIQFINDIFRSIMSTVVLAPSESPTPPQLLFPPRIRLSTAMALLPRSPFSLTSSHMRGLLSTPAMGGRGLLLRPLLTPLGCPPLSFITTMDTCIWDMVITVYITFTLIISTPPFRLDDLRVVQEETPQVTTVVEETHQRQTFDPRAARTLVVRTGM